MDLKLIAKRTISIIAVVAVIYSFYKYQQKSIKNNQIQKILNSPSGLPVAAKSKNVSSVRDFSDHCKSSFETVKNLINNKSPKEQNWKNYYLTKNGEEFVLRIEKDSNLQKKEIDLIKFYKLDKDGFPKAFTAIHNTRLKNKSQLDKILKGYSVEEISTTETFTNEEITIERFGEKIARIMDQKNAIECLTK